MSITTNLECHRGEDVQIVYTCTEDITGWALRWTLKDAADGTTLMTKTTDSGITISTFTATVIVPSAILDIAAAIYWHSLVRTDPGAKAVLAEGTFNLRTPRAT